jgi:hypothetical protein
MSQGPHLHRLPSEFRDRASVLRDYGAAVQAAHAWEQAAELLEEALREAQLEALTIREAAQESGYSASHLRRLIREGDIPDSGTEATGPRILRRDLPRKPGYRVASTLTPGASSRVQLARAVAEGGTDA